WMTRKPGEYLRCQPRLGQDIPDRFGFTRCAHYRANASAIRFQFHKAVDPMFVRTFTGCDRIPQHRGEDRLNCCQVADHSAVDEAFERRHQPGVEQRVNNLPISCIPADQQYSLGWTRSWRDRGHARFSAVGAPTSRFSDDLLASAMLPPQR